jgi:hypothetical protein
MTKRIKAYRYELMHGDDADFIAINAGQATASGRRFRFG